jgi:hypothetical protein
VRVPAKNGGFRHGQVTEFGDQATGLSEYMQDPDILALVGRASEFSNLKVRARSHCRIVLPLIHFIPDPVI